MDNQEIFARGVILKHQVSTDGKCTKICWSPDGDCLAIGNDGGSCILWSLQNNKSEWRDTGAFAGVTSVDWDSKGQRIGIGCLDGTIQIQFRDKPFRIGSMSPGKLIREDTEKGFFQWENLIQLNTWGSQQISSSVASVQWSNSLDVLLSSHRCGSIATWNYQNSEIIYSRRYDTGVDEWDNTNSMNPKGNWLAFFNRNAVQIWDIKTWVKEFEINEEELARFRPSSLEWSKDGKFIAIPTWGGRIFIYDIETKSRVKIINASRDRLGAVSFSHDGSLMAAIGTDQIIRVWRTDDWSTRIQLPALDGPLTDSLAFHPKYHFLAVGTKNGSEVKIFEIS